LNRITEREFCKWFCCACFIPSIVFLPREQLFIVCLLLLPTEVRSQFHQHLRAAFTYLSKRWMNLNLRYKKAAFKTFVWKKLNVKCWWNRHPILSLSLISLFFVENTLRNELTFANKNLNNLDDLKMYSFDMT
jgi:hypothetical protein